MKTRCWAVDVKSVKLAEIIKWCVRHHSVNRLLVGFSTRIRSRRGHPQQVRQGASIFGTDLLEVHEVKSWPGPRYCGGARGVAVVALTPAVIDSILKAGPQVTDWDLWHDPSLPEDICLFRQGARFPSFVSIAHEDLAWILSERVVRLKGVSRDNHMSLECLVRDGRHYCEGVKPCRLRYMRPFLRILKQRAKARGDHPEA